MKVLIIGCGSIGARHARNLSQIEEGELLLYDSDPDRSRALQKELSESVVVDLEDGLAQSPDAALICTPTHLHVEMAIQAVRAGAHLFIEKPISHVAENVDAILAYTDVRRSVLLVGCNMRFHRPIVTIKRWLDQGALGRLLFGRFRYGNYLPGWRPGQDYRKGYSAHAELGGGIILDAIHEIDYARWFFGEPDRISAMSGQVSQLDIDTEDVAEISIHFAAGAMANIHLDYLRPVRARSCELVGEGGLIVWQAEGKVPEQSSLELYRKDGKSEERLDFSTDLNDMYVEEMRHFLRCVRREEYPALDGRGAKRVLEIALMAKNSAKSGRVVPVHSDHLNPDYPRSSGPSGRALQAEGNRPLP